MGHVIGNLSVGFHQFLDAIEHGIEIFREPVPFVTSPAQRYPFAEPASHNLPARRVDCFDPGHRTARCRYARGRGEDQKNYRGRGETDRYAPPKSIEIIDVAAKNEMV